MEGCLAKLLLLWVLLLIVWVQFRGHNGCFMEERIGLLELKAFLKSKGGTIDAQDHILPSWLDDEGEKKSDCCDWEGVKCKANNTSRLFHLSLANILPEHLENIVVYFNVSLFRPFEELASLDLSGNWLDGFEGFANMNKLEILNLTYNFFTKSSILQSLGALPSLRNLNLSNNIVTGSFPSQELASLKSLEILDLRFNQYNGPLPMKGLCELQKLLWLDLSLNKFKGSLPLCLGNLTSLQILDISENQLSGNISVIAKLTSLKYLSLFRNQFEGLFHFSLLANHSKLEVLNLRMDGTTIQVQTENIPWVPSFQLKSLHLPSCNLNAPTRTIPSFLLYQKDLKIIDLSDNHLVGLFPNWLLDNNTQLEMLHLMNNSFTGSLQVPAHPRGGLFWLDISNNKIDGQIPVNVGNILSKLGYINVSSNYLEGEIPSSLGEMTGLWSLDLSNNNFSGKIPTKMASGCFSLLVLKLSNNNFEGQVFLNSTQIQILYLDNNYFDGNIEHGLTNYSPNLIALSVANNNLSGKLPSWIGNFQYLSMLDMSANFFEGTIPEDLCKLGWLQFLDLSENRFSGTIPSCFSFIGLKFMHLQRNSLTGSIPDALYNCSDLVTLDLRDNQLSEGIPYWINELLQLRVLLLSGNKLQGLIPTELCQLKEVSILDLSHNRLSGQIPSCFNKISFRTTEAYAINGTFSLQIIRPMTDTVYEKFMVNPDIMDIMHFNYFQPLDEQEEVEFTTKSRSDTYKGSILYYMSGLDLSCNKLTGGIPLELGDLVGVHALNLSCNSLNGTIPMSLSKLRQIESLDLSRNNLSGHIPSQLTELTYLAIFNVSYNNLSGITPDKGQFATFDDSNYKGNPGLCGPLLKKSCVTTTTLPLTPSSQGEVEDADTVIDMVAFYWSFGASYVTVLLVILVILWINPYWRRLWFHTIHEWILSSFCQY